MPYVNGKWETEDDGVEKRLTGLLAKDSAYMQQGATAGLASANKRGLLNSSMAVRAAEGARIEKALPIASQEASGILQKNLSRQGFEQSDVLQGKALASNEGIAARDIMSREKITGMDIASREGISAADRGSRETLAREGEAGALTRLNISETGANTRLNISETGANTRLNISETGANTRNAADITSRETIAREGNATQRTISDNQINSQERVSAGNAVSGAAGHRTSGINAIMANPDIPADVRNTMIENFNTQYEADVGLIEQIYDVDLTYGSSE
jgi:hypothetical protein